MGRKYTVSASAAVTTAGDLMEVNAPANAIVRLISAHVGQDNTAGDADAEMLRVQINRASTGGSGGGTPTARPHEEGDAAFGGTCESFNTTDATGLITLVDQPFNAQAGFYYEPGEDDYKTISPSQRLVLFLEKAPTASIDVVVSMTFEEIGG